MAGEPITLNSILDVPANGNGKIAQQSLKAQLTRMHNFLANCRWTHHNLPNQAQDCRQVGS